MALDISRNLDGEGTRRKPRRPVTTRDARLTQRGYVQIPLGATYGAGHPIFLGQIIVDGQKSIPDGSSIVVVNVEAGSIRYRDDGQMCDVSTGELWPAGQSFMRTLRDLEAISLCAIDATGIVNLSFYSVQ